MQDWMVCLRCDRPLDECVCEYEDADFGEWLDEDAEDVEDAAE